MGGTKAGNGKPVKTVDILFPYQSYDVYPSPFQLTSSRDSFSGFVGPDGNITAVGGDGGGTSEEIGTCPSMYMGPDCTSVNATTCNYGYVKVNGTCTPWYGAHRSQHALALALFVYS
jgi:hypothetical protein